MKEFHQKKSGSEIKFIFEKEKLHYFIKDEKSKAEFSLPYDHIESSHYDVTHSNDVQKHYATYLLVVGLVTAVIGVGILMLVGSGIMYFLYKRSIVQYTVYIASQRRIYIIHDEQYDKILEELLRHRSEFMKNKYGVINPHNPPDYELKKFEWLLEQQVITEEEFNEFKFQLLKKDDKILN